MVGNLGRKKTKQNISQGENSGLKKRISQKHLYCKKGKKEDTLSLSFLYKLYSSTSIILKIHTERK
jgi:hypothetical protein